MTALTTFIGSNIAENKSQWSHNIHGQSFPHEWIYHFHRISTKKGITNQIFSLFIDGKQYFAMIWYENAVNFGAFILNAERVSSCWKLTWFMNDLTNSMLRSRAYVSLLQESRIRAPKIVFGKSLSSLLIRSRAYSMASSRWTPFSCLTAPHGGSLSDTY